MTVSRAKFKLALRYIKRHENMLRQDAIANALCDNSGGKFWKEIKKMYFNTLTYVIFAFCGLSRSFVAPDKAVVVVSH